MRCPRLTAMTLLAGFALGATAAHAGVYLESVDKELDGSAAPVTSKMWFDGGRMRIERMEHDGQNVVIFKNQTMYTIDSKTKSYGIVDKATAEKMGTQVAAAKKQMEARMAAMPPEQRKKMEEMMAKLGQSGAGAMLPGAKPEVRSLKNTGRSETVAGIKCAVWEVSRGGKKEEEVCAAPAGSVPNGDEVIKTFRDIGAMLKTFTDSLGTGRPDDQPWHDMDTLNGVPILTREFSDGKATSEMRLSTVRKESVSTGSFDVPAGYAERKLNLGKPPGGGAAD